jgi:LysM repeat protein
MIGRMGGMSFLVSTLLAFALAAAVLAAALLVGLFPTGPGGVSVATTRPPAASGAFTPAPNTPSPIPTLAPTSPPPPTTIPPEGGTYTVKPGDSLSLIGLDFGIPWQLIAEANSIAGPDYVIVPGQVLIIPAAALPTDGAGADFHVVRSGDTITAIAQEFGVDPTDMADFNNIADWNSIRVGDILYIPGADWQTPLPQASF